jgi:endonuclease-3
MARPKGYKERALEVNARLKKRYPNVQCALDHKNPFELTVATILSAQCTDVRVNMVTPGLFKKFPDAEHMALAKIEDVEELIRSTGFFRNKAKNIIAMSKNVVDKFNGKIPSSRDELTQLAGVGRKTANVVLSNGFKLPGLPVDTHVTRLCNLLKIVKTTDAVKIEFELMDILPEEDWGGFSLRLIEHGRQICIARRPKCEECVLNYLCPSSKV